MSYQLGIDLGTTFTAAAVFRDGAATIFTLGTRAAAIPSVVLLREDGSVLIGDSAERRAMSEPERVVREFKRRLGDTTPIIVGGAPHAPEALIAHLLDWVYKAVCEREGGIPTQVSITHPANWGTYKKDLLERSVQMAGVDANLVSYITEPEAAALSYAAQERIDPGEVVAVYDLGGGTFDAAVLRRTPEGFSVIGKPEGIERLGGIDFDSAVFKHVTAGFGKAIAELDDNDPAALAAVARLRQDCTDAKEALSSDTDATVPVLLPNLQTEVRITRAEFENMVRPSLLDSLDAMKRAVQSADLEMTDVTRVLLVGGSSRIPLVSLLVTSELGRPVAVDAHPKHAIAIGAAFASSGILDSESDAPVPTSDRPSVPSGVDPNMTIVAPAHLYNPAIGTGKALPIERPAAKPAPSPVQPGQSQRSALPVERPAPVGRSLPIEGAAAPIAAPGRPPKALPVERPGAAAPPANPPKAQPVSGNRPPPPGAVGGGGRPPPPASPGRPGPGDYEPTSVMGATNERTQIYPGGNPPSFDSGRSSAPGQVARPVEQAEPKKRSGAVWFLSGLVVIAVIVLIVLLVTAT